MRRDSYIYSAIVHVVAILLTIFGIPFFWREPPIDDQPIVVDIVPLGDKTNPPPLQSAEPQPEAPKPQAKPEPPKPEPPKPAPPPPPPPPPPPKPEVVPPPPKPEPKPEPKPAPKPEPPKPEPRPQPPKPDVKPEKSKPRPQDEVDSLLKSLDKVKPKPKDELDKLLKAADKAESSDKGKQSLPQNVRGSASNNPMEPVSMTEIDMIRAQIYKCWNIPAGAKDAANLIVPIRVRLQSDGTVISADIVDTLKYASDSYYRAAADSARRAVLLCSPLKAPPSKYDQWKDLTLRFNPKDMVGQ